MKITNKEGWCLVLLAAIQLGYTTSFNENSLREYLAGTSSVEYHLIPILEREALTLSRQICIDGRVDEANNIVASL